MKHTEKLEIPPVLQSKLEDFRSRLWSVKIGEGALAGIAGLILSFLFVFALDRFIDTPIWVRWMILFLGFSVPAIGIPIRYHRWVWQKRSLGQIAKVLRKRYPRLGDELLGIVDLAKERSAKGHSQTLITAAMEQVAKKVKDQEFADAVPENHYRKWMYTSIGLGLFAALAVIIVSGAAHSSVARWLTPWRLIERYTFAKLEPVQREMVVPFAEHFDLSPQLRESTEWKPDAASVRLPGKTRLKSDLNESAAYEFSVPPQKEDGALSLRVGDAVEKIKIKPMARPELSDIAAKVRLPDYLMYQSDPVIPVRGGTVDVVEGATASFIGTANRELAKATVNGTPAALSGNSFSTRPEPVEGSETQLFEWEDRHGLTAKSPYELRVNAIPDGEPDVFAKKLSTEQVVLPNEVVSFEINSSDDFGLREVGLEWVGVVDPVHNPEPAAGGKMVAPGGPEKRTIEATGTFSAERNFVKPQTLEIRAYAEDYLPNRNRSYSPVFVLHVMNPSDHANWLTHELGKWFSRAREVYEREQQLHEANRDLRSLSVEELDRPENRRKLERQASAESSNARRLEALTSSGRDLIRQATKNDEFAADRLESWAKMMRSLDEISKDRMPSVSDLLKKAAQAAGSQSQDEKNKPGEQSDDSKSNPSAPSVNNQNGEQEPADSPKTKSGEDKNEGPQLPKAPSISDKESGFDEKSTDPDAPKEEPGPPSKGALGLPQTMLNGEAEEPGEKESGDGDAASPSQEQLDLALAEQEELLKEFARVTEELQEILSSLEASTFVKRLKAASRKQLEIAKKLNDTVSGGFGISRDRIAAQLQEVAIETAKAEAEESDKLYTIQSDLDAYYQRKQDGIYKNVLDQMRSSAVVTQLKKLGEEAGNNFNGRSIAASEFWSDTLDRWAEELVSASQGDQKSGESGDKKSLPPEIVLEVMKIARGEMELRDQTREMENIRSALSPSEYAEKTHPLEMAQTDLRSRVDEVVIDLLDLPDGEENFGNEMKLLNFVSDVMRQARGGLSRPDTGPEVIAAQTEAIELLLQTNRQPPNNGGGGGGGSPGGGANGGNAGALSDIGVSPGMPVDPAKGTKRSVGQSTGKAGQEFPEEFRHGLDTYFNELEKIR